MSKAIRDGVIDATINHDEQYIKSLALTDDQKFLSFKRKFYSFLCAICTKWKDRMECRLCCVLCSAQINNLA